MHIVDCLTSPFKLTLNHRSGVLLLFVCLYFVFVFVLFCFVLFCFCFCFVFVFVLFLFFQSKSFVEPNPIPLTGKINLTMLLLFIHSIVSNILCDKRIGFIMLSKKKVTTNHGLLLSSERVLGVIMFRIFMKFA